MGTIETPVTMQTGAGHKYFSSPASVQSESDNVGRLMPRTRNQLVDTDGKIKLIPRRES